jgi:hypothetical protein
MSQPRTLTRGRKELGHLKRAEFVYVCIYFSFSSVNKEALAYTIAPHSRSITRLLAEARKEISRYQENLSA